MSFDSRKWLVVAPAVTAIIIGAIGFALGQSITGSSDVRIIAQKLVDGRIEFGLEQDGEQVLPRARFFPANARVGRWLKSSPIDVSVEPTVDSVTSSARSISGSGDAYKSAGVFSAGNYVCSISVTGNENEYGADHFSVVSYGADGSYGNLHVNEIASSYSGSSRLSVGSGWSADVPEGDVYFEVTASTQGQWTISCR